jgi:phenylacetate 2-hydroxylase
MTLIMDVFQNNGKDLPVVHVVLAFTAAFIVVVCQSRCKLISRIGWEANRLLGGAPHTTHLPGPPGLPIVGNLYDVSTGST